MIGLAHYLLLAGVLFSIAVAGIFINRKNVILLLMCIELMLNSVNLVFVTASNIHHNLDGQVAVLFVIMVAAVEAAIGLAITIALFRHKTTSNVDAASELKG